MIKKVLWAVMALASVGVAGYAISNALVPGLRQDFVVNMFAERPIGSLGHLLGGGIALAVGVFQFNRTLRNRFLNLHRWMGRIYVLACWVGGLAGLYGALYTQGTPAARFGFGMLAVTWLISTSMAYLAIRGGDVARHQQWMIRSFALTLAAVTLRVYLPLAFANQVPFEISYPVIAWMCWVPNLIVAEWFLLRQRPNAATV